MRELADWRGVRTMARSRAALLRARSAHRPIVAWRWYPGWVGCLAVLLSCGCSSPESVLDGAVERGPLPYHVGLYLESYRVPEPPPGPPAEGSDETDPFEAPAPDGVEGSSGEDLADGESPAESPSSSEAREPEPRVQYTIPSDGFLKALAGALDGDSGVVAKATPIQAASRAEALESARRLHCDRVFVLSFDTDMEYREYSRPAGWVTLEIVCWLLGGIPSWFVPTVHYDTHSRLVVEEADPTQPPASPDRVSAGGAGSDDALDADAGWRGMADCDPEGVSLWDRSHPFDHPLQYLATILVPPLVHVPGDAARLSGVLSEEVEAEVGERLRGLVRDRLVGDLTEPPLKAVFVSPDPHSVVEAETLRLRLGIGGRESAPILAMDVNRIAKEAPVVRWKASQEDIARLAQALEATQDPKGYVDFDVPQEFPLEPGENLFKVRLLGEDRVLVTSTMLYRR